MRAQKVAVYCRVGTAPQAVEPEPLERLLWNFAAARRWEIARRLQGGKPPHERPGSRITPKPKP